MTLYNIEVLIFLTFKNIDQLFYNKEVRKLLPELSPIFTKWDKGFRTGINKIKDSASIDLLNKLTKKQLEKLEALFGCSVSIKKLNKEIIKNKNYNLDCVDLLDFENFQICLYREDNQLYLLGWR